MRHRATALLLMLPLLSGADQPAWLDATRKTELGVLQLMEKGRKEVDAVIKSLGNNCVAPIPAKPDETLPPAREGYAVAVADGGLLFDSDNSRVTYIGNVRVNEARVNMRCRNKLYIQLPPNDVKKSGEEAITTTPNDQATATGQKPPHPASAPAQKATAQPVAAAVPAPQQEPLQVRAYDAMVDGIGNHVLLLSKGKEGVPHLQRGKDEMTLSPGTGDSYVLADSQGNIHVFSGKLSLSWTDTEGKRGSLVAEQGRLVFNRANHTVYIPGVSHFTAPDGSTLDCEESLCVTLMPEGDGKLPENGEFLSQFTSLRYSGVEKAVAMGKVRAYRPATDTAPTAAAQGDVCIYNGRTGACEFKGSTCRLTYGTQEIQTLGRHGMLTLSPDGDIRMEGEGGLSGVYELPARQDTPAQHGSFETSGELQFYAATGTVELPRGIRAQDPDNRFSCTGPLHIALKPGAHAVPPRARAGMLNLAIAAYNDVSSVHATGAVDMHYLDRQKNIPADVRGDETFFDLDKGTAQVVSAANRECFLAYGDYRISARNSKGTSTAVVNEQGDIDVRGGKIHAVLPDRDGTAVLDTNSYLHLTRETRKLQVGPGSHLQAPEGIMTAQDILYVTLAPAPDAEKAKPAIPRYPHLNYAFGGVESADTDKGGTVRTAKASMQCTGPIHMTYAPEKGAKADSLAGLRATAERNVAILGKDSSGRLIRATGDRAVINGETKILTGMRVSLADEKNTHIASGKGAKVTVDGKNNARINGEKHVTYATHLHEQTEQTKNQEKKD